MAEEPQVEITVNRNGPYRITGPLKLMDHQGNELEVDGDGEIFLCRCGHSNNKPFCDGTHRTVGFRGPISEAVKKKGEKAVQGEPLP